MRIERLKLTDDRYTTFYASGIDDLEACVRNSSHTGYPECAGSQSTDPDGFPIGPSADEGASWLYNTPIGIRKYLKHITTVLFPSVPDIMVSEFGFAEPGESQLLSLNTILWDLRRADYFQASGSRWYVASKKTDVEAAELS